jgi:hypothetical protein
MDLIVQHCFGFQTMVSGLGLQYVSVYVGLSTRPLTCSGRTSKPTRTTNGR